MKNLKFIYLKITLLSGLILWTFMGCERDLSEDAKPASFSNNPEVYIDGFSSGLDYFPFANSFFEAFTVDEEVSYSGSSAMRFDVPNVGDSRGPYAGAIFRTETGRDLSGYDALTFWAKATYPGTIDQIGFGQDFEENKHIVTMRNLRLTTNWVKYTIPLPDAAKLTNERGMFWYAEGPENGNGYTFWIDELKFEKLGTIGQYRPAILNGVDRTLTGFVNSEITIDGLIQTVNLASGVNKTVEIAPAYFEFSSSNATVATVNSNGLVSVHAEGTAEITATFNGVPVPGSLSLEAIPFSSAPEPSYPSNEVISIYSDSYNSVNVDYFNGYWQPYQTTESTEIVVNNNAMINYSNLNFVGIQFTNPTVNADSMRYMHIDIYTTSPIRPESVMYIDLIDFNDPNSRAGAVFNSTILVSQQWMGLEIDLQTLGLANRDKLAQIVLNSAATLDNIYVDNIFFHN
ncbi:Ig-like domain-containing protein [Gaetbulibacter saemankumensis]|uniref:Ig-like domain-containing protein n=1 Tax=Gaetbulibacter saemankumensis TaxID=311208 RepID=UPI00040BA9FA|nr:Ig-like domain-containing protein [Gaetbulibacter saemankumensis]